MGNNEFQHYKFQINITRSIELLSGPPTLTTYEQYIADHQLVLQNSSFSHCLTHPE